MLNRRLIVLFLVFVCTFGVLAARLAKLQLVDAEHWQGELRAFIHRHRVLETSRGKILDRNGVILAQDLPCDEIAIDYRAMNLDDVWLAKTARARLKVAGEKRPTRAMVDQMKEQLADQIDAIPEVIARECQIPLEEVLNRFNNIRERIHALRQDLWSQTYKRRLAGGQSGEAPDPGELDAEFNETQLKEEVIAHAIVSPVLPAVANYFRQHAAEFPGLVVRDNANRRDYPFGDAAAHVLGTLRSVDDKGYAANRFNLPNLLAENDPGNLVGYLPGDRMGETGAERTLESILRGSRGVKLVDLAEFPGAAAAPSTAGPTTEESRRIDAIPGRDVRLTLDMALQQDLFYSLKDPKGHLLQGSDNLDHFVAIVVMSMDGQVLAMVSWPSYDPNTLDANRALLYADRYRTPLVNRVTSAVYQPGSTIKPMIASAGLSEHVITAEDGIMCTGHLYPGITDAFRCLGTHGSISLVDALAKSCNIYFYTTGSRLGLGRLCSWLDQYGYGRDTGLEFPEATGFIPNPAKYPEQDAAAREAVFLGIGQGQINATPLQMANAYATLLRGGIAIPPRILVETPAKQFPAVTLAPGALTVIREGMVKCVTSGTAEKPFTGFRLRVGGKSGTATTRRPAFDEKGNPTPDPARPVLNADGTPQTGPDGRPLFRQAVTEGSDAWFIGYAPADRPQYVVAAIMEFGGHGGAYAAPMVREAFRLLQKHNYLPHTDVP